LKTIPSLISQLNYHEKTPEFQDSHLLQTVIHSMSCGPVTLSNQRDKKETLALQRLRFRAATLSRIFRPFTKYRNHSTTNCFLCNLISQTKGYQTGCLAGARKKNSRKTALGIKQDTQSQEIKVFEIVHISPVSQKVRVFTQ